MDHQGEKRRQRPATLQELRIHTNNVNQRLGDLPGTTVTTPMEPATNTVLQLLIEYRSIWLLLFYLVPLMFSLDGERFPIDVPVISAFTLAGIVVVVPSLIYKYTMYYQSPQSGVEFILADIAGWVAIVIFVGAVFKRMYDIKLD